MNKIFYYILMLCIVILVCYVSHFIVYAIGTGKYLDYNNISELGWFFTIVWYILLFSIGNLIYINEMKDYIEMKQFLICLTFSIILHFTCSIIGNSFNPFDWKNIEAKVFYALFQMSCWLIPIMINYLEEKENFKN